jgi:hypothetical protein
MIIKVFLVLIVLNFFALMAKADTFSNVEFKDIPGQTASVHEGTSKVDCIKRAIALLGSRWLNNKILLSQLSNKPIRQSRVIHKAADLFAHPRINLGLNANSSAVKLVFAF